MSFAPRSTSTALATICLLLGVRAAAQVVTGANETPAKLQPTYDGFDYVRREAMIPMRDGVRLHTVVLVPKNAARAPMLMTRTPYDANALTTHAQSAHLAPTLAATTTPST